NNRLPALSCLPVNKNWFWKTTFPKDPVKDPKMLVNDDIVPFNNAWCNFILNVAPNRDGLIDENALQALQAIGKQWKNEGPVAKLPEADAPIISSNIAKHQPANSSWSDDMNIMDFANDDDFTTDWTSNTTVKQPWWEVVLDRDKPFNAITITEAEPSITKYHAEYFQNGTWKPLFTGDNKSRVKIHRFDRVWGGKVRITIDQFNKAPRIAEVGVYDERR
ncbi:MAG TPA: discoidin domain-containing protein, partial [Chitinophaga sp.]|uniref:discoidin domain-containing protein n=1 Tax=Chitinophaga sp. TaxID=1869181 RepID=UPI002F95E629